MGNPKFYYGSFYEYGHLGEQIQAEVDLSLLPPQFHLNFPRSVYDPPMLRGAVNVS